MYLAIDPGLSTGWAVLDATGTLVALGEGESFPVHSNVGALIELPQVYRAGKSKGDPNNLITLAVRVGRYQERLVAAGVPTELVRPVTWKGQVPKEVHHPQVCAKLTDPERLMISSRFGRSNQKNRHEDVWDAVALAKWGFVARRFAISRSVR